MKICINKKRVLYQVTIIAAVFSDILRIPGSPITLYRILVLFVLFKCYRENNRAFQLFLKITGITFVINLAQAVIFGTLNRSGFSFSISRFLEYQLFYISIFVLCLVCNSLYLAYGNEAEMSMYHFIILLSWIVLVAFVFISYVGNNVAISRYGFANVNNYAIYIASAIPFHLFMKNRKIYSVFYVIISCILLAHNDCVIALFGVLIEIVLYFAFVRRFGKVQSLIGVLVVVLGIIAVIYAIYNDVPFLSQNIGSVFKNIVDALKNNSMYKYSNTSISFRINVLVMGLRWLLRTFCLGIGAGNSTVVMTRELSSYKLNAKFSDGTSMVALHNAPLELLLDFGVLAIILFIVVGRRVVEVIRQKEKTNREYIFLTVFFGALVWIYSPSGITSTYFIFVVLAYLACCTDYKTKQLMKPHPV